MATARVEAAEPVPPPPRKVILELTEEEAGLILLVAGAARARERLVPVVRALDPLFSRVRGNNCVPDIYMEDVMPPKLR